MRHLLRSAALLAALVALPTIVHGQSVVLFQHVRLFDGERVRANQDILIRDGKIAAVGAKLAVPAGAQVVDGTGKTLLPGLIDAHTHTWGDALSTALVFGVTTELDMFTDAKMAAALRAEQRDGKATARADLYSAGVLVTVPKGHGTEYGFPIPTITNPDSAQIFVDARLADGSDYIKIIYDDGHTYGTTMPTLSKETLRAVIAAAHKRGKLAVVHIGDLAGARTAIEAGADGLMHLFVDRDPDPEFGRVAASHHAFVVPTLTVLMSITGAPGAGPLADDPNIKPYLNRTDLAMLKQAFPRRPGQPPVSYTAAEATVRQLRAAGVPILAGTDAGNPGTSHGAALHRELELLVKAGLTPTEALASATSVTAKAFRLGDRGRVANGMRADLVLVEGDPTADITATRRIVGVWKGGVPKDRAAFAKEIAAQNLAATTAPAGLANGLVSDFDDGSMKTGFGAGWAVSNDAMANGTSTAEMKVVDGGANGSAKSLAITGTITNALPYAWAGAMFTPGGQMFQPVNLSSKKEIRFWAKGDGQTYRVFVFAESKGYQPLTQTFVAGPEWKEFIMPIASFSGIDGHDIMAIIFAGGPTPGTFSFQIDDVRLR